MGGSGGEVDAWPVEGGCSARDGTSLSSSRSRPRCLSRENPAIMRYS